jgi:predicted peptidase
MKSSMHWISLCVLTLCLCGSFSSAADPELDRFDLGQRLIQLERAWDAHPDAAARARAMPVLKLAVPQLLAGRETDAAATLDRARMLLQSAEPTAADRWTASLAVHPPGRLLDKSVGVASVRIVSAYGAGDPPPGARVYFAIVPNAHAPQSLDNVLQIAKLPADGKLSIADLPDGDYILYVHFNVNSSKWKATYTADISVVTGVAGRIGRLRAVSGDRSVDTATLDSLTSLLTSLARGSTPETNYPAARLLAEAEALAKAVKTGQRFYGPERTGQFWLTIPTGATTTPVRLFIPDAAKAGKPMPLVVGLHGAGGSENLFFEAYGYGLIARLAQERGWMVVAPRAGWLFDGPPPAQAIVDELAKLYPVDKQSVYLVGHSMGAMQAVTLAQQTPGRYAAIAALGGGGTVTKPDVFKTLPVFIGCGREDFLLGGAKGLAQGLEKAGATRVTYKEYPNVEHMLIVQEALPEVFKFFEKAKKE